MAKRKTTIYIDEDVLRASKIEAARSDRRESEVIEDALREYLGLALLQKLWAGATMSEDDAMKLAIPASKAVRREMQQEIDAASSP